jgi:hypothetical protein
MWLLTRSQQDLFIQPMDKDKTFYEDIKALHQFDCDAQKENFEKLKEDSDVPAFLEQQAVIGRLFKAGMEDILAKSKQIINPPE